jgi:RNA polymerase sigma factor for flagellar operon FliA
MLSTLTESTKKVGRKKTTLKRIAVTTTIGSSRTTKKKIDLTIDWHRYQLRGDTEARAKLLRQYLPLVRNVAGRMAIGFPRSVELSDLINTGVIGLVEAFRNFDPERGVKFETYAVPRIRGAILDELRALDWVPRSTRAKSREIERAVVALESESGRRPSEDELARKI